MNDISTQTDPADLPTHSADSKRRKVSKPELNMRDVDLQIALSIAGFAGMPTRDRHGNVVPEIWTKLEDTESAACKLLDFNDMRVMLKEQLSNHLIARKDLLLEVDSSNLVAKWIFEFSEAWEKEYRDRSNQGLDIAQMIITAMEETLFEVKEILDESPVPPDKVKAFLAKQIEDNPNLNLLNEQEASIRFYFRNKFTGPMLIHIAGKKLQKQVVCNRSGAYSAKVQRNDVTQEVHNAVDTLYFAVMDSDPILDQCQELLLSMVKDKSQLIWIHDHRRGKTLVSDTTS